MSCQGTTRLADLVILLRLQQHENRAASQPHSKGVKPISDRIVATIFTVPRQRSRFAYVYAYLYVLDNACFRFMRGSPRSFGRHMRHVAQSVAH